MKILNYIGGNWIEGDGEGTALVDPVSGVELARASSDGINLDVSISHARNIGGPALKALTYSERGHLLEKAMGVLNENRAKYGEIALSNSGNTKIDAAIDIDGGTGTLFYYSRIAKKLGDERFLQDPGLERIGKDINFQGMHLWVPIQGVAIHINAFNFPSWGLWEKVAVSILSGVPVIAKPATSTCLLSYEMFKDIIDAKVFPDGSLNLICGSARNLVNYVTGMDAIAFTGSAETASILRTNKNVASSSTRFNVESDSLNMSLLGPDAKPDTAEFKLFIKEVSREMTVKAGQKCTAIRRALVPAAYFNDSVEALESFLAKTTTGDPRNEAVRMGPLVNKIQQTEVLKGINTLKTEAQIVTGGAENFKPIDADPDKSSFIPPTLLQCKEPKTANAIHDIEVFGPVCTIMPYDGIEEACTLANRGGGSLVASIFSADVKFSTQATLGIAANHGRVLLVDEKVSDSQTGHGIVMPMCTHGGPGRAGGGEELGGTRGLRFYHQRTALQGHTELLERLSELASETVL